MADTKSNKALKVGDEGTFKLKKIGGLFDGLGFNGVVLKVNTKAKIYVVKEIRGATIKVDFDELVGQVKRGKAKAGK